MKVLFERGYADYQKMFANEGWEIISMSVADADLVVFEGGEDVTPRLYGCQQHPSTYNNVDRDLEAVSLWLAAKRNRVPCVGICRGGQFLNVMNGGAMHQDVQGHCGNHPLSLELPGWRVSIQKASSTHHQMMVPNLKDGVVIGTAPNGTGYHYCGYVGNTEYSLEHLDENTEVVYYSKTSDLCFQPHPEFEGYDDLREVFFETLNKTILGPI